MYAERPSKSVKLAVAPLRAGGAGASEGSIFIFFVVCRVFHTLCNQLVELLSSVGKNKSVVVCIVKAGSLLKWSHQMSFVGPSETWAELFLKGSDLPICPTRQRS